MDSVAACTNVLLRSLKRWTPRPTTPSSRCSNTQRSSTGSSGSVLAEGGARSGRPFPFDRQGPPRWHLANKHVTTNPVVAVNDDEATIRSMYTVFQQTETLPMQAIIAGRYHDTLRRIDGTWRLVERRYFADLIGDLSDHLTFDL